jgi:hypothetical protein
VMRIGRKATTGNELAVFLIPQSNGLAEHPRSASAAGYSNVRWSCA